MKRLCPTEPQHPWSVFANDPALPRNYYRPDDQNAHWQRDHHHQQLQPPPPPPPPPAPAQPPLKAPQRELLDGIIDGSIANVNARNPYPPAKAPRLLPLEISPLLPPKRTPTPSVYTTESEPQIHSATYPHHSPLPQPPYRSLDTLPSTSLHLDYDTSEKDSYEKARAEIEEILSPVSDNGARRSKADRLLFHAPAITPTQPLPPSLDASTVTAQRAPVVPAAVPRPPPPAEPAAMRDALSAMGMTRSPNGLTTKRRSSSASTKCHLCGKTYTETSNLSKHVRTVHLKLRPFRCHLCPSSFAEKNKLGKHIQSVHEHARPYKCDLCSATFSQASDRKRHRLVLHEGRRPFICRECGKAFGRRSSLTQHCHRVHNKGLPKPAGECHSLSRSASAATSLGTSSAATTSTGVPSIGKVEGVVEDGQRAPETGSGMSVATLVTPLVPPLIPPLVPSLAPPLLMPLPSTAEIQK